MRQIALELLDGELEQQRDLRLDCVRSMAEGRGVELPIESDAVIAWGASTDTQQFVNLQAESPLWVCHTVCECMTGMVLQVRTVLGLKEEMPKIELFEIGRAPLPAGGRPASTPTRSGVAS